MSINLSPVAVTEFDSMVKHAFQNASLLRDSVTVRNNVVGDTYKFRAMGKGLANQKATSADVDPMDVAHSLITATLQNWNAPEYTDVFDQAEVNFDEKQELATTIAGALGRRLDQLVIAAMDAASPTAVGVTTTGLLATDLIDAKVQLVKNGVGSGDLTVAINGTGLAGLLADEKVSSADYQNVKALVNGEVNTFAGFNVVVLEDRAEGGLTVASDVVSAYAFDKSAVGLAIGMDMKTSIDYVPQKTSFLCNGMLKAGAAVRDVAGLVEIKYDATPA
jgi:Tfp pilus assembly protein PilV